MTTIWHRIASVDREIENDILQLISVHEGWPQSCCQYGFEDDRFPHCSPQQVRDAADDLVEIGPHRGERLAPGEGQQAMRELGGVIRALQRKLGGLGERRKTLDAYAARLGARKAALQSLEIADDYRKHIVEVMRNAAGQLADRFHLLRL